MRTYVKPGDLLRITQFGQARYCLVVRNAHESSDCIDVLWDNSVLERSRHYPSLWVDQVLRAVEPTPSPT